MATEAYADGGLPHPQVETVVRRALELILDGWMSATDIPGDAVVFAATPRPTMTACAWIWTPWTPSS